MVPFYLGSGNSLGTGDRAWFRYRYWIALVVPVSVPVQNSVPVGSYFQFHDNLFENRGFNKIKPTSQYSLSLKVETFPAVNLVKLHRPCINSDP